MKTHTYTHRPWCLSVKSSADLASSHLEVSSFLHADWSLTVQWCLALRLSYRVDLILSIPKMNCWISRGQRSWLGSLSKSKPQLRGFLGAKETLRNSTHNSCQEKTLTCLTATQKTEPTLTVFPTCWIPLGRKGNFLECVTSQQPPRQRTPDTAVSTYGHWDPSQIRWCEDGALPLESRAELLLLSYFSRWEPILHLRTFCSLLFAAGPAPGGHSQLPVLSKLLVSQRCPQRSPGLGTDMTVLSAHSGRRPCSVTENSEICTCLWDK
jgi:hypothetical protein